MFIKRSIVKIVKEIIDIIVQMYMIVNINSPQLLENISVKK